MKTRLLILSILTATQSFADPLVDEGISDVQGRLNSPEQRQDMIKDKDAVKADERVRGLSGSASDEQAIYNLATQVLGNFKGKSQEDVMQTIEQANRSPEGFANTWTPEQTKRLREISSELPASKSPVPLRGPHP